MNSRRNYTILIVLLLLTSLLLVACERPLQTSNADTTAEEAYPAATDTDSTGDTAEDAVADEEEAAPPDAGDSGAADTADDAAAEAETEEEAAADDTADDTVAEAETEEEAAADDTADDTDAEAETEEAAADDATEAGTEEPAATEEEAGLEGIAHTVAEGETIFDIAALYGASWVIVAEYNQIGDISTLEVGTVIYIPDEETSAVIRDELAAQLAEAGVGEEAEETGTEDAAIDTAVEDAESEAAETAEAGTGGEAAESGTTTETIYVVQRGDTLYRIGLMFGISWVQIAEANGIMNPNDIKAGQELKIPVSAPGPAPEFTHVVQSGETLFKISLRYGVSWQDIARANQLRPPYTIYPGQTLIIPGNGNG